MSIKTSTGRYIKDYFDKNSGENRNVSEIKKQIEDADAIVIGAGAGLSAAAGYTYKGSRFEEYFSDFKNRYHFTDMYSGGFYPYNSLEEHWAYWSRYVFINRYQSTPRTTYADLNKLIEDKNYFIITTNVDHCFQRSDFQKERLFYTQGDYGLFQCSVPCHQKTYDNETIIKKMMESQGYVIYNEKIIRPSDKEIQMRIPSELVPKCPVCGRPMSMNLRADSTFVQDLGWYQAAERYDRFLNDHKQEQVLFLELGVGYNTPEIIKYPFWQYTKSFPNARYICINQGEASVPSEIKDKSLCFNGDIEKELLKI